MNTPAEDGRDAWRLEPDEEGIAWLHLDCPGATNTLSRAVLAGLEARLDELQALSPRGLVIRSDKPGGFIAGADVGEFRTLRDEARALEHVRWAQDIFRRLADLRFPTVAMIHGYCLGGGLELALACRYRVAEDGPATRLGLPEVRLGIHPGYGGTVRLPPLIGDLQALDLMLTGRTVSARAARRLGLVDHALPERQLARAARHLIHTRPPAGRARPLARLPALAPLRPLVVRFLARRVEPKAPRRHYPAPWALLELWQRHRGDPEAMMAAEARSVARLVCTETAANLIRVFFLQTRLKGLGGRSPARHLHVVGAGTMGGDIAAWAALRGLRVTLQDRSTEQLGRACGRAAELFRRKLHGRQAVTAALDRLIPDPAGAGLARADVVIEAIYENLEAKQALFREVEARAPATALLATNTSSLPLEEIGSVFAEPGRLVGLHFFNPVARMQLVEVVRGRDTGDEVVAAASAFVRRLDRLPLPVSSSPGFLVNRILMPYLLEAVRALEDGIPAAAIDRAALDFGMPMGPLELADTVGLDICRAVAEILAAHLGVELPGRLADRVEAGRLGRKTGAGFYEWQGKRPVRPPLPRGYRPPPDLQDRLILPMLNEAVACLHQGVVADEDLLDAGVVFGTGFAPFRGGPMHYLHRRGVGAVLARLVELEQTHGPRFHPGPGWDRVQGDRTGAPTDTATG